MPVGDKNVRRFFTDLGFDVKTVLGLKCKSPVLIAHTSEDELKSAINEVNNDDVDAIVQAGTNLAMARVAAVAEEWLNKPVIAINTATKRASAVSQNKSSGCGLGIYKPLLFNTNDSKPRISMDCFGLGKFANAPRYQKIICNKSGVFLRTSTYQEAI